MAVCLLPQLTFLAFTSCPILIRVGAHSVFLLPVPSAPYSPIPQEYTSPFLHTTAEWPQPHDTFTGREGSWVSISHGQELNLDDRSLIPRRPSILLPIAYSSPSAAMNIVCSSPQDISEISTLNEQKRGRGCDSSAAPFSDNPSYPKWSSPQANTSVYSLLIFNELYLNFTPLYWFHQFIIIPFLVINATIGDCHDCRSLSLSANEYCLNFSLVRKRVNS